MSLLAAGVHCAGFTVAGWAVAWLAGPSPCHHDPTCREQLSDGSRLSAMTMAVMMGYELLSLAAAIQDARRMQLQTRCLPGLLLATMFGVLAASELLFSRADWTIAHVVPVTDGLTPQGKPLYSLQYLEWTINVPILVILSGHCLGRPSHEVMGPMVATNGCVLLSWAALCVSTSLQKWLLIAAACAAYAWAFQGMCAWCRRYWQTASELPCRRLRPFLVFALALHFGVYGVVYLASATGILDPLGERMAFRALTCGAKIAFGAAFVFLRSKEYHEMLANALEKISRSNAGMVAILRGSFDMILPCVLAGHRCLLPANLEGDMAKLQGVLKLPVAGASLSELVSGEYKARRV